LVRFEIISRGDGGDDGGGDGGDAPGHSESRKPRTQQPRRRPKQKQTSSLISLLSWFPKWPNDGESVCARQTDIYEWPFRIAMLMVSTLYLNAKRMLSLRHS
jgi:hypothetical protein